MTAQSNSVKRAKVTSIRVDPERWQRLKLIAHSEHRTVGAHVQFLIDRELDEKQEQRAA